MKKWVLFLAFLLPAVTYSASGLNIAVVDMEALAAVYDGAVDKATEFNNATAVAQAEVNELIAEIEELNDGLDLMTPANKTKREELIQEKLTELADFTAEKQTELAALQTELANELIAEIQEIIREYATEMGYDLIIPSTSTYFYIDSIDITQDLIDTKF